MIVTQKNSLIYTGDKVTNLSLDLSPEKYEDGFFESLKEIPDYGTLRLLKNINNHIGIYFCCEIEGGVRIFLTK